MYTNSGKKGATHDNTPEIASRGVGAASYIDVQVFAHLYGSTYSCIACPELYSTTQIQIQVPCTHNLLSFVRDCTAITRRDFDGDPSRPLSHVTLGSCPGDGVPYCS